VTDDSRPLLIRLLFAPEAPEDRLPVWLKYVLPLLCFAVVWSITAAAIHYRVVDFVDEKGYIATADYVRQHGHLSTENNPIYRQFPGLSLLMIPVDVFVGNLNLSGHIVVALSAVLAVVLVQYLFDDFRLTIIFTFFFPWWITTSVAIFSEPPIVLCFLVAVWALRDARPWSVPWVLGLLVGGYGIVIRQTAFCLLMPFLLVYEYNRARGSRLSTFAAAVIIMLPFVVYLSWNALTIHELFPQLKLQQEFMAGIDQSADHRYSDRTVDIPFKGLITALTDPGQSRGKKLDVLATLAFVLTAFVCLVQRIRRPATDPERRLAEAFAATLAVYFLFHMSIGGVNSFRAFERYLCPIGIIAEWAIFYRRPLRWPFILVLLVYCVAFDSSVHVGLRSLFFK
jgi:hypothetical protein